LFGRGVDNGFAEQVGLFASKLTDYINNNQWNLKVAALHPWPDSPEEGFLKRAVSLVNDRCCQESGDDLKFMVFPVKFM